LTAPGRERDYDSSLLITGKPQKKWRKKSKWRRGSRFKKRSGGKNERSNFLIKEETSEGEVTKKEGLHERGRDGPANGGRTPAKTRTLHERGQVGSRLGEKGSSPGRGDVARRVEHAAYEWKKGGYRIGGELHGGHPIRETATRGNLTVKKEKGSTYEKDRTTKLVRPNPSWQGPGKQKVIAKKKTAPKIKKYRAPPRLGVELFRNESRAKKNRPTIAKEPEGTRPRIARGK